MLRYLTAGESHGPALLVILEGMPSGVKVQLPLINEQLARRQKGYGRGGRMKIEQDEAQVLSGLRAGLTLGSPIGLRLENKDWRNWERVMDPFVPDPTDAKAVTQPRPGHADLAGGLKYQHTDLRNVLERASARETTAREAAGAIARQLLSAFSIEIVSHVTALGGIEVKRPDYANTHAADRLEVARIREISEQSPVRCLDAKSEQAIIKKIDAAKKEGDSLGGIFEVIVTGLPVGLGSHVQWDRKLDGQLAQALMSIQAIKGVEVGMGFEAAHRPGSQVHDEIFYDSKRGFYRNHNGAGGLEGGMTNGSPLVIRVVKKPISTLYRPLNSVDLKTKEAVQASVERSDTTAVPAAAVIGENVVALTLARAFLEKFGGDSLPELQRNYQGYLKQVKAY